MKREHKDVVVVPQIQYLLKIEDSLVDKSDSHRVITNHSAVATDGYIEVTTAKTFDVPYSIDICKWNQDGYTLEMDCFQINSMTGNANGGGHGTFVCQGNNPGGIDYWSFGLRAQKLTFYYYSGAQRGTTGSTTVPLNEWHHIKFRYYQGVVQTFLDGNLESTINVQGTPQFSSSYRLVFMGYSASNPGARIKNIRIYMS
jgi:hypothetical protein